MAVSSGQDVANGMTLLATAAADLRAVFARFEEASKRLEDERAQQLHV
jgi:hypothetical protein